MAGKNLAGFPQFERHLAAIHRMPPTHSSVRKFHASDIVYAMLRRGVGRMMLRRGVSAPSADNNIRYKADRKSEIPLMRSNSMWKATLRKPY